MGKVILDLCGGTGSWSRPYVEAGYDVHLVTLPHHDVRSYVPPERVHGILAAPPCTEFSIAGARWWSQKSPEKLVEAIEIVRACLLIIARVKPAWWALENPMGRLRRLMGEPNWVWEPWEFGDPWLKKTCIWGRHNIPQKRPCKRPESAKGRWQVSLTNHLSPTPTAGQIHKLVATGMIPADWVRRLGPSPDRATLRSITPPGFARAFFEANP